MKSPRLNLDALGVCASTLCMIHCLVLPLLLAAVPMWSVMASAADSNLESGLEADSKTVSTIPLDACCEDDCCAVSAASETETPAGCCSNPIDYWIHAGLLSTVAPLGLVAWGMGYQKHRRLGVVGLGFLGVLLLTAALLFGTQLFGGRGEQVMTVMGSICMVAAHLWNRQQCKCCHSSDIARSETIESMVPGPEAL